MPAEILLGHEKPALFFHKFQRAVDFFLTVLYSQKVTFRRTARLFRRALIPQLQNTTCSVFSLEIRMTVIHTGIHNSNQHSLPGKSRLSVNFSLYRTYTTRFRSLIHLKIETLRHFRELNLRLRHKAFQLPLRKRYHRISAQKGGCPHSFPGQRPDLPTVFYHYIPHSCFLCITDIQIP